jgi:hypothetical protein
MERIKALKHQFVESFPEKMVPGTLYVSIQYASAGHLCCCGCGREVVTPISPTDWALTFDGDTITLEPSIGNWNFPCRSHYWIRRNKVRWSWDWSDREVDSGRQFDAKQKDRYYRKQRHEAAPEQTPVTEKGEAIERNQTAFWTTVKKIFSGK